MKNRGRSCLASLALALVTDLAEQTVPPSNVSLPLYAFRGTAINDTEHAPALLALGDNDFNRVSGCAEDRAHLGHISDRIQDVNGVRILDE